MRALLGILMAFVPSVLAQEAWSPEAASAEVKAVLIALGDAMTPEEGSARLDIILDDAIAHAPLDDHEIFTTIVSSRRLVAQIGRLEPGLRARAWPVLHAQPELAEAVSMLVDARRDNIKGVYEVFMRLHEAEGDRLAAHPGLVAALCVVHDDEFPTGATSSRTSSPDPIRMYRHLTGNRIQFDLDELPPELLIHMVDSLASQSELDWAWRRHSTDRLVGKRYHDVTYDTRYYKHNAEKRISNYPYTLPNIRQHGGVCTDQAYYAATIGKAIGVPTAIVSGRAGEVGHCWVGFVRRQGGELVFDFDEGRYDDFEDVRGIGRDPQTGRTISDDEFSLRADLASTSHDDRLGAIALLDAEQRVRSGYRPPDEQARPRTTETRLALLRAAVNLSPADARTWQRASTLASSMSSSQLRTWANALHAHFGDDYPTFTFEILTPMITSVADTREQSRLWEWAYARYRRQHDLSCEILVQHARLLERKGQHAKAYDAYVDAAHKYVNETAAALDALRAAEAMLVRADKPEYILSLYEEAWRRVQQPSKTSENFIRGTNWYKVGTLYLMELRKAGRSKDAQRVADRLRG